MLISDDRAASWRVTVSRNAEIPLSALPSLTASVSRACASALSPSVRAFFSASSPAAVLPCADVTVWICCACCSLTASVAAIRVPISDDFLASSAVRADDSACIAAVRADDSACIAAVRADDSACIAAVRARASSCKALARSAASADTFNPAAAAISRFSVSISSLLNADFPIAP